MEWRGEGKSAGTVFDEFDKIHRVFCAGTVRLHQRDYAVLSIAVRTVQPPQIQRMVGLTIAVMRGLAPADAITKSLTTDVGLRTPVAPASLLYVAEPCYSRFLSGMRDSPAPKALKMELLPGNPASCIDASLLAKRDVSVAHLADEAVVTTPPADEVITKSQWRGILWERVVSHVDELDEFVAGLSTWAQLPPPPPPPPLPAPELGRFAKVTKSAKSIARSLAVEEGGGGGGGGAGAGERVEGGGLGPDPTPNLSAGDDDDGDVGVRGRDDLIAVLKTAEERGWAGHVLLLRGTTRTLDVFQAELHALAGVAHCTSGLTRLSSVLWALAVPPPSSTTTDASGYLGGRSHAPQLGEAAVEGESGECSEAAQLPNKQTDESNVDRLVSLARCSAGVRRHLVMLCYGATASLLVAAAEARETASAVASAGGSWSLAHEALFPPALHDTLPFHTATEAPALAIRLAGVLRGTFVDNASQADVRLVVVQLPSGLLLCREPTDSQASFVPPESTAGASGAVALPLCDGSGASHEEVRALPTPSTPFPNLGPFPYLSLSPNLSQPYPFPNPGIAPLSMVLLLARSSGESSERVLRGTGTRGRCCARSDSSGSHGRSCSAPRWIYRWALPCSTLQPPRTVERRAG